MARGLHVARFCPASHLGAVAGRPGELGGTQRPWRPQGTGSPRTSVGHGAVGSCYEEFKFLGGLAKNACDARHGLLPRRRVHFAKQMRVSPRRNAHFKIETDTHTDILAI